MSLQQNDIIVSMDVTNNLNDFMTTIDSYVENPYELDSACCFNHTQQNIPAVLTFLNPENQLSVTTSLTVYARTVSYPFNCRFAYALAANATVTWNPETDTIALSLDRSELPYTIEKLSDNHFIVHFEYNVKNYDHSYFFDQEEYRGNTTVVARALFCDMKDISNNWKYKSASIYSNAYTSTLILTTPYPEDGVGFDFNQFRNLVTHSGIDNIPVALDYTPAAVTGMFTTEAVPVFVRLTNTADVENWKGFVLQSRFITSIMQVDARNYSSFCMSKPDTQPGLLCVAPYDGTHLDYHECNLRYGSLSEDGSTVTWSGDCGLIIENASTDTLNISLLNAPADWTITAVTRGEDGWYVDLSGSATPAA